MRPGKIKDKFVGCMIGTHVGDALGMPVEGHDYKTIESSFGELRQMLDARLGVGTYTDDTEMMIGIAESLVECKGFNGEDMAEAINMLGNDSSAPNSVPTAIYSFISHSNNFEDAVTFAVSLGGDTDTIGAMTGAISGAYHGKSGIPQRWLDVLENGEKGRDYIEDLAGKLWEIKLKLLTQ